MYLLKQPENPRLSSSINCASCFALESFHSFMLYEARWNVPWREAYGTTESGADLFVPLEDAESVGTGAMGKPVRTKEARVVDPEGRNCPMERLAS